jgi:transglutaminase-like putative cysteine protease
MKLSITHRTIYEYTEPVTNAQHLAHLTPRDELGQRCLSHDVEISPVPISPRERLDYFGNRTLYVAFNEPHRRLSFNARSLVDTYLRPDVQLDAFPGWQGVAAVLRGSPRRDLLDASQFGFESPHVKLDSDVTEYAAQSFGNDRPILSAVADLVARVHADFKYDPEATDVSTPVSEVFLKRRGVCQDFAHLCIAGLRGLGLPARYVSGYLLTRPPPGRIRLEGADASHAWFSVFVPDAGWFDFDPTNNMLASDEHVVVAWGRDFSDVTPIRGVILGGGRHTVKVSVDVVPV